MHFWCQKKESRVERQTLPMKVIVIVKIFNKIIINLIAISSAT